LAFGSEDVGIEYHQSKLIDCSVHGIGDIKGYLGRGRGREREREGEEEGTIINVPHYVAVLRDSIKQC
jgi:hypothetical protein